MFVDHAGHFFYTDEQWLRAIGRAAAPIFFFLTGFAASYRWRWDLFWLATALAVSHWLMSGEIFSLNILFTILACRLVLRWWEPIRRPFEWYIGCLAWLPLIIVTQYGSLAMLFALCGYFKRRSHIYAAKMQRRFWLLTFVTYGVVQTAFTEYSIFDLLLLVLALTLLFRFLWRFEIKPVDTGRRPSLFTRGTFLLSRYSGYVYAFHLMALEWLTGVPY